MALRTDTPAYSFLQEEEQYSPMRPKEKPLGIVAPWSTGTTTTPATETPPATVQKNPYDEFDDLVNQYASTTISPKEQARRERAAMVAQGVGALGNAMNAFSNIAFTGGTAPSQKLPELTDTNKDVQEFRARIDKNRAAYLNAMLTAKGLKNKDAELAIRQADLDRKIAADKANEKNKKDLNDAVIGLKKAQAAKDWAGQAYWEAKEEALREGMPLDLAEKRAKIAKYNAEAYKAKNGGSSGSHLVPIEIRDEASGELKTIYVTGNAAQKYYESLYPDDSNTSTSTSSESYGGTVVSSKTTERERGKSSRQKSGEATLKARQEAIARKNENQNKTIPARRNKQ